jgi:hypothetical protein
MRRLDRGHYMIQAAAAKELGNYLGYARPSEAERHFAGISTLAAMLNLIGEKEIANCNIEGGS